MVLAVSRLLLLLATVATVCLAERLHKPVQWQHVALDRAQEYRQEKLASSLLWQQQSSARGEGECMRHRCARFGAESRATNSRFAPPPNTQTLAADVETFYIRKGANGTLPCLPVPPGDSQAAMSKIEWFKEERKLVEAEAKHLVVWNTKNTIAYLPESGALLFRGVSNEDSGEYHCLVSRAQVNEAQPLVEDGVVRFYVQGKCSI